MGIFLGWAWWRTGLAVGGTIKRLGYHLLDAGWGLTDRAARRYRPEFEQFQPRR